MTRLTYLSCFGTTLFLVLMVSLQSLSFGQSKDADQQKPGITITSVPNDPPGEQMAGDPIKGTVSGVDPKDYMVVVYAYGDKWYVQPTAANPLISIKEDKTWESETHGGFQFVALIVKSSYEPLATLGTLPKVGGDVIAISEKKKPEKK